ncbi:hypothetical protein [Dysgonomonas termitidis]
MEVNYIGPFPAMPGDDWHDFRITGKYQDEIITVSGASISRDLRPSIVDSGQLIVENEKKSPEVAADGALAPAYMAGESILKPEPEAISEQLKPLQPPQGEATDKVEKVPPTGDRGPISPELKTLDIAFTSKGGRLMTHTIEGTCTQNAVLHAYSYLYREAFRGASDIRIHAGGHRVGIHDIRKLTPLTLLYQLVGVPGN